MQFNNDNVTLSPILDPKTVFTGISELQSDPLTIDEVESALIKMNCKSAPGPDDIHY